MGNNFNALNIISSVEIDSQHVQSHLATLLLSIQKYNVRLRSATSEASDFWTFCFKRALAVGKILCPILAG